MKFNLCECAEVVSNIDVGNIQLDYYELTSLISDDSSAAVTLNSTNSVLCIDVELKSTVAISDIKYKFDSMTDPTEVLSGISIYYKSNLYQEYTSMQVAFDGTDYICTDDLSLIFPRYIRIVHSVDGTSITGNSIYFSVTNDDSDVRFGDEGSLNDLQLTNNIGDAKVDPVKVFNNGTDVATATVYVESDIDSVAKYISISESIDGEWSGPFDSSSVLLDSTSFTEDAMDNVLDTLNGILTMRKYDTGKAMVPDTVGTFTSHIFDVSSLSLCRLGVGVDYGNRDLIRIDSTDVSTTINVKCIEERPIPYTSYFTFNQFTYDFTLEERQLSNDEITNSAVLMRDVGAWNYAFGLGSYKIVIDDNKTAAYVMYQRIPYRYGTDYTHKLIKYDLVTGSITTNPHLQVDDLEPNCMYIHMKPTNSGGIWVYFYTDCSDTLFPIETLITSEGYQLMSFDSDLNLLFNVAHPSDFITDMSVIGEDLWYYDKLTEKLTRLSSTGQVLYTTEELPTMNGIESDEDGGCWATVGDSIYKFNKYCTIEKIISNLDNGDLGDIVLNYTKDRLYVTNSIGVMVITLSGDFEYLIEAPLVYRLKVDIDGVWASSSNGYDRYINIADKSITITKPPILRGSYVSDMDYLSVNHSNSKFHEYGPVSDDTSLLNASWQKIDISNYVINPACKYMQIQASIRRERPEDYYDGMFIGRGWEPNDSFDKSDGESIDGLKWNYNQGCENRVEYVDGKLRLLRSADATEHDPSNRIGINSKNKMYVYGDFEVYIHAWRPDLVEDSASNNYFGIRFTTHDESHYFQVTGYGSTSSWYDWFAVNIDGVSSGYNVTQEHDHHEHSLYIKREGNTIVFGRKYYANGEWSFTSRTVGTEFDTLFYVEVFIREPLYSGLCDLDLMSFELNALGDGQVCWPSKMSPGIKKIYTQKPVVLRDIPAGHYKDIYLKTDTTNVEEDISGEHDVMLDVSWEVAD